MNRIPMTINGYKILKNKLKYLKNICRPKIINSILEARTHGDLKENAEYHSAKEEQGFCENKIKEIEIKLFNSFVIDIQKIVFSNKVIFGSTVKIKNLNKNKIYIYKLVGDDEADIKKKFISINSPIARGLISKKKKDIVSINTPGGIVKYIILKILYI